VLRRSGVLRSGLPGSVRPGLPGSVRPGRLRSVRCGSGLLRSGVQFVRFVVLRAVLPAPLLPSSSLLLRTDLLRSGVPGSVRSGRLLELRWRSGYGSGSGRRCCADHGPPAGPQGRSAGPQGHVIDA